jgi:hypothetical protein
MKQNSTSKKKKTLTNNSSKRIILKEEFLFELKNAKNSLNENVSFEDLADYEKPLFLSGIIQRCNTLNQNGRVYPRNILVPKLEQYIKTKVETGMAYGALDHKDSEIVEFESTAFRFTKIWLEEDVVYGEIVIIPGTEKDKIIKGALKTGGKIGISSRAMGSISRQTLPEGIVADVVQDDLHLICWDIVTEPSTPKAFMEKKVNVSGVTSATAESPVKLKKTFKPSSLMNENKHLEHGEYNVLLDMAKKLNKGNS